MVQTMHGLKDSTHWSDMFFQYRALPIRAVRILKSSFENILCGGEDPRINFKIINSCDTIEDGNETAVWELRAFFLSSFEETQLCTLPTHPPTAV